MTTKSERRQLLQKYPNAGVFIDHYLTNYVPEEADTFRLDFTLKQGPSYEQGRAYNAHMYDGITSGFPPGMRFMYVFGSISKGMLANGFVMGEKPKPVPIEDGTPDDGKTIMARHVYDLDENIGSTNALDKVFRGNKWMQLQKLGLTKTLFPEYPILVPSVLQSAVSVAGQPNFDLGAKRRDNQFMQLWLPLIREKSGAFYMDGDWHFSGASSGEELSEAVMIAAGKRKRRPDAGMRFLDVNGNDVSLFEINRRYAEFLLFAAREKDFFLKHEPTALMWNFAVAAEAKKGQLPNANPVFLKGALNTLDATEYLQKEIEPLILERVASRYWQLHLTDYLRKVNPEFAEKVEEAKKGNLRRPRISIPNMTQKLAVARIPVHDYSQKELMQGDFEYRQIADTFDVSQYLPKTEYEADGRPMRHVDMAGRASTQYDGRSLFSREFSGATNERERLQAGIVLGELEVIASPKSRLYYVVGDDKLGPVTETWKQQNGLNYADEVPGSAGRKFAGQVRAPQRQMILDLRDEWRGKGREAISSIDIQDRLALFGLMPEVAVAPGEAMPGSAARTMARHAFLARNVTDFCFKTGQWEQSNDGVQDMILALRMQTGLQAGSAIDPRHVRIFDEKGVPFTVARAFESIFSHVEKAAEKGRDLTTLVEPVTALAQIWALHRTLSDHTMRGHVFQKLREERLSIVLPEELPAERISMFLSAYDHGKFEDLWARKAQPLMQKAALAVRMDDLKHFEDFAAWRTTQEAALAIAAAGRPEDRSARLRNDGSVLAA